MKELIKRAEQGDVEAQVTLAVAYLKGERVEENHEKACGWISKAAESGIWMLNYYWHFVTKMDMVQKKICIKPLNYMSCWLNRV